MDLKIKTVSRKLTSNVLSQMAEATAKDIIYALKNKTVIGYVNPVGSIRTRVFLIQIEDGDYRIILNIDWKIAEHDPTRLHGLITIKRVSGTYAETVVPKPFATEAAKIAYLENYKKVKRLALENHIYI